MKIRPANPQELDALSALCLRSKAHWDYDADFIDACREPLTLHANALEDSKLYVAELEGDVAGVVQIERDGNDAELEKLFIDPAFMGRGVGNHLMQWALAEARKMGAQQMLIASDPFAMPFYQKYGARQIGTIASEAQEGRQLPRLAIKL